MFVTRSDEDLLVFTSRAFLRPTYIRLRAYFRGQSGGDMEAFRAVFEGQKEQYPGEHLIEFHRRLWSFYICSFRGVESDEPLNEARYSI